MLKKKKGPNSRGAQVWAGREGPRLRGWCRVAGSPASRLLSKPTNSVRVSVTPIAAPGKERRDASWDYARPRILENKKAYTRLVERAYVRCSPVRLKRVRSTVYGANNLLVRDEGEVDARDQAHMVWDRPKPGTAGRNAFESVCGILTRKAGMKAIPASAPKATQAPAKTAPTKTPAKKPVPKN